ncbi:unnamed protein product, partial [Rotaria sp. Silwood2]
MLRETTNKVIKHEDTFRERLLLSGFLVIAIEMAKKWSRDRDKKQPNVILFVNEPTITLKNASKATDETDYYVVAGATEKLTKTQ